MRGTGTKSTRDQHYKYTEWWDVRRYKIMLAKIVNVFVCSFLNNVNSVCSLMWTPCHNLGMETLQAGGCPQSVVAWLLLIWIFALEHTQDKPLPLLQVEADSFSEFLCCQDLWVCLFLVHTSPSWLEWWTTWPWHQSSWCAASDVCWAWSWGRMFCHTPGMETPPQLSQHQPGSEENTLQPLSEHQQNPPAEWSPAPTV